MERSMMRSNNRSAAGDRSSTAVAGAITLAFLIVLTVALALAACTVADDPLPRGRVSVESVHETVPGYYRIVLKVTNTGSTPITQSDITVRVRSNERTYWSRTVDTGVVLPSESIGVLMEIALDTEGEVLISDSASVEWVAFS